MKTAMKKLTPLSKLDEQSSWTPDLIREINFRIESKYNFPKIMNKKL